MIRPQDPKETGNAEFSYSFYMVQSYDMTTLGVPEKIQEPADQMILARLKMQQLVAKMRPTGTAVNWRAVQNIDYGLGEGNKAIDFKKMFDQTGDFYYHDQDAEGNPIGVPFTEIPNAGFLPQLQALILLYDKHYQIMKDELGEDPNLISAALQPRVAAGNVETSQQMADFATDYYYSAYINCLNDTAKKVSCLLKDSVTYGSKVYRNISGIDDIGGRMFSTKIQLLPDAVAIQKFELMMQKAMDTTPEMSLFVDPFQLMRVAKEDVKLSEALFRQGTKKMILHQQETAAQNQKATFDAQHDAAVTGETEKRKTMTAEVQMKGQIESMISKEKQKEIILSGIFGVYQKGIQMPTELKELEAEMIKNVAIPLFAENIRNISDLISQTQEEDTQEEDMGQNSDIQPQNKEVA